MGVEIERKFLVSDDSWREAADVGTAYRQGYLIGSQQASVRVRIEGETAKLNIKSATLGIQRQEFEYEIPLDEAKEILDTLCEQPQIEKVRHKLYHAGHLWEIDVFSGANQGLIVAEVELSHVDEALELPAWVGQEVSDDPRYYNVCLVKQPYNTWK